jgi:hypothetical protein
LGHWVRRVRQHNWGKALKRVFLLATFVASFAAVFSASANATVTGAWSPPAAMAMNRSNATAAQLRDGRVLVAGGVENSSSMQTAAAEIYDPATGAWSSAAPMHESRWYPLAASLPGDRVLLVGESDAPNHPQGSGTYEVFDGQTNTWSASKSFPSVQTGGKLHALRDGRVLYVDVTNGSGIYDPSADAWTTISVPWAGAPRSLTELADGRILVTTSDAEGFVYDPASGQWSAAGSPGTGSDYVETGLLADGRVVGVADRFNFDQNAYESRVVVFDPATATWSAPAPTASMHAARLGTTPAGDVLAIGGEQYTPQDGCTCGSVTNLNRVLAFDPGTSSWVAAPSMSVARSYPVALTTTRGVMALSGEFLSASPSSEEFVQPQAHLGASIADTAMNEGNNGRSFMDFTITLSQPAPRALDITATTSGGTATAGSDYRADSSVVRFKKGQQSATYRVQIIGDKTKEENETFNVTLSNTSVALDRATAIGTISDDDLGTCTQVPKKLCVGPNV